VREIVEHAAKDKDNFKRQLTRKVDADHPRLDEMLLASGRVARYQGDRERARREIGDAFERFRRHHGEMDRRTLEARAALER
jgi:hypothetical protein